MMQLSATSSFTVDQCLNVMNGHTLGSRATVALVHLTCSLEAGAEMEEGANVFWNSDPCEDAMEFGGA
jgi:hypothetical protein